MAVHDISDLMPARIHLTVPPGFRKKPPAGIVLYRGRLTEHEVEQRDWFRVTTPLRTLMDVAQVAISIEHIARGIQDAVRKGLLADRHIETAVEALEGPAAERLHHALMEARRGIWGGSIGVGRAEGRLMNSRAASGTISLLTR
jgi:hypothetical protein